MLIEKRRVTVADQTAISTVQAAPKRLIRS